MTNYNFGDLVLVSFRQATSSIKKRPALVILDIGDNDIILAPVTSKSRSHKGDTPIQDWKLCGLLVQSRVRLAKINCLEKTKITKHLGHLSSLDKKKIQRSWKLIYQL